MIFLKNLIMKQKLLVRKGTLKKTMKNLMTRQKKKRFPQLMKKRRIKTTLQLKTVMKMKIAKRMTLKNVLDYLKDTMITTTMKEENMVIIMNTSTDIMSMNTSTITTVTITALFTNGDKKRVVSTMDMKDMVIMSMIIIMITIMNIIMVITRNTMVTMEKKMVMVGEDLIYRSPTTAGIWLAELVITRLQLKGFVFQ